MHISRLNNPPVNIFHWKEPDAPPSVNIPEVVLSIGVFDGVHRGHQELLTRTVNASPDAATVLTFSENPASIMRSQSYLGDLSSLNQRLRLFSQFGVRYVVLIDFKPAFSQIDGSRFVDLLMAAIPSLQGIVVGYDFHLGKNRDTHGSQLAEILRPHGKWVDIVHAQKDNEGSISSSRIRRLVLDGEVERARLLLGRSYAIDVQNGLPAFRSETRQITPSHGCFRCLYEAETKNREGTVNIDQKAGRVHWQYQKEQWTQVRLVQRITDEECLQWL